MTRTNTTWQQIDQIDQPEDACLSRQLLSSISRSQGTVRTRDGGAEDPEPERHATEFVESRLLATVERLGRLHDLTIGAVFIAVANSLAVREYRG